LSSAPPDLLGVVKGPPTSKGREEKWEGKGKEIERGREGEGVRRAPISCWHRAPEG